MEANEQFKLRRYAFSELSDYCGQGTELI
jgi:hypothetical protein